MSLIHKFSAAALALAAFPVLAADPVVVPTGSELTFTARQMGVPLEGRFKQWSAQLAFDPKKPEAGKVAFTLQMGSASFGAKETDAEVPKAEWFNVARFPTATFQSSAIKGLGGGKFEVSGKLAIKGSTRDVVVPVALTQSGGQTTATGSFALKRLDFKIGEGEWTDTSIVANDVTVKFRLAITGMAPL
ncbi:YceI family protein [Ideonella livida]|uniref:YceI family protein n=1 Tax=Ideonella livida TaxID=2707176 RepID=A0A7C9TI89_9BURK|nr:YceI family protein [Ideonella livida]NDY91159.1 YceI family protein [Ideonella livida]